MSNVAGGNLAALQTVSQETQALWDQLRVQISPLNLILTLNTWEYRVLTETEKNWIRAQYSAIINTNVMFVHDCDGYRVFLAGADVFPPGCLLRGPHLGEAILVDPQMMGNGDLSSVDEYGSEYSIRGKMRGDCVKQSKILRPANAFILYRQAHHEAVKAANPGIHNNMISVIIGNQWQREDAGVRAQYKLKAAKLKEKHMEKYPDYQYQPRKTSEVKRRMTKKKAAALNQKDFSSEDFLGIGSNVSDHDFSAIHGTWQELCSTSETNCDTAEVLEKLFEHNEQQAFNPYVWRAGPEVEVIDNIENDVMAVVNRYVNRDAFDEFIDTRMLAHNTTS